MEKALNMSKAIERYNDLMYSVCYEHCSIGTSLSEHTENWNLRDMVAEADYILSGYYEEGHMNNELKEENPAVWRSETGKLKRFIAHYEPFIKDMKATCPHCSPNYD